MKYYDFLPGQLKQHIEVAQEPIAIISAGSGGTTFQSLLNVDADPLTGQLENRNDPTTDPNTLTPGGTSVADFSGFGFDYRNFLNNHDEFCELWIAKCPLVGSCILHYNKQLLSIKLCRLLRGQNYHRPSFHDILLKAHVLERTAPILEDFSVKKILRELTIV